MSKRYTSMGKQVLCDGAHFADAVDTCAAQIIVDTLNGERVVPRAERIEVTTVNDTERHTVVGGTDGSWRCSCGRVWDHDEGDVCPGAS